MRILGATAIAVALGAHLAADAAPPTTKAAELTPLEQAGLEIYVREGCMLCHAEPAMKGAPEASKATGPSLRLVGGKYPDAWHYEHLRVPRAVSPASVMPPYPWLLTKEIDESSDAAREQGQAIATRLHANGIGEAAWNHEVVALIAYLQSLGLEESKALAAEREAQAAAAGDEATASFEGDDPDTLLKGQAIFQLHCAACHGIDLTGGVGPNLIDEVWVTSGELDQILAVIRDGVPAKGMPGWGPILGDERVGQVAAYVYAEAHDE